MIEPELITIIEGPTPDFQPGPRFLQKIMEGPGDEATALCELRTGNGQDIIERCERAWGEGRPVKLDYPDNMRLRQQVDVVALRLMEVDEGELLRLWVSLPIEYDEDTDEEDDDDMYDDDDGLELF